MFECMEISESIYEDVVEFFYLKHTRVYKNRADISRKTRVQAALPNTYPKISESTGKNIKGYVYHV